MVELVLDCRCELGEGPIWDDRVGRLLFVDINAHRVHIFDPESGAHETHDAGEYVSAIALAGGGGYLVALQHDIARFDPATPAPAGGHSPSIGARVARVEGDRADTRFNDGAVDPRGRFWAGTMSLVKEREQAALYRVDGAAGGSARVSRMLDAVTTSNGIDWSPDERLMYYVDTGTRRIDVFDFDAASGSMTHRRPLVMIPEGDGKPDGLIVDAEGCLWVALWQGGAIRRYAPDGRLDRHIPVPVSCPTKCAFGGARLDTLYVTSARTALSPAERAEQPHAGSVFAIVPGVRGRHANRAR